MTIAEKGIAVSERRSASNTRKQPPSMQLLEDEILVLRTAMVQMYGVEETFQSELIIDLSQRLDVKINEYMHNYYGYKFK